MSHSLLRTAALAALAVCAGCSAESDGDTPPAPAVEPPTTAAQATAAQTGPSHSGSATNAGGFEIMHASWGHVADTEPEPPAPPVPTRVSYLEGRLQKFQREAAERWQGTEVFVRRKR